MLLEPSKKKGIENCSNLTNVQANPVSKGSTTSRTLFLLNGKARQKGIPRKRGGRKSDIGVSDTSEEE